MWLNVQFAELLLQPNLAKVVSFFFFAPFSPYVLSGQQRGPIIALDEKEITYIALAK